jgi:SAM-dependent methyltransferase
MSADAAREFNRDEFRSNLLGFTRQAFQTLPPLQRPRILDIGCGSGVPTIEIARLSGGVVIGMDVDRGALWTLRKAAAAANLSSQIKAIRASLFHLCFPPACFEIIWAEGSVAPIGFERALNEWRVLLVPGGHLVVHDDATERDRKLACVPGCGYRLLDEFTLAQQVWWEEYYQPMNEYIDRNMRADPEVFARTSDLRRAQEEIAACERGTHGFSSFYAIMQKTVHAD